MQGPYWLCRAREVQMGYVVGKASLVASIRVKITTVSRAADLLLFKHSIVLFGRSAHNGTVATFIIKLHLHRSDRRRRRQPQQGDRAIDLEMPVRS